MVLEMVHISSHEVAPVVLLASHSESIKSDLKGWCKETGVTAGVQVGQRRFGRRGKKMNEEKINYLEGDLARAEEERGQSRCNVNSWTV